MNTQIDLDFLRRRESEQVEWKDDVADVHNVTKTLSAFANDLTNLGGGYVVCGVKEEKDAHGFQRLLETGLSAARLKEVEGKVMDLCRVLVAPTITPVVTELPGPTPDRRILIFTQPATPHAHTFRDSDGGKHYVRISRETKEARNGVLRELLVRKAAIPPWDHRPCDRATVADIDLLALRDATTRMGMFTHEDGVDAYLRPNVRLHALLPSLCVTEPLTGTVRPRNYTILLFGREPQKFIPGGFSLFSHYQGRDRSYPHAERHELGNTAIEQVRRLTSLLEVQATTVFDKTDTSDPNKSRYPVAALKEALVNTVAHRDYELHEPVRITVFSDRIEFMSPGPLPLGVDPIAFQKGQSGPRWRNQVLAWFFNRLGFAQAEGQGIPTIRRIMKAAGCPPPKFAVSEASVTCILYANRRAIALTQPIHVPDTQKPPPSPGKRAEQNTAVMDKDTRSAIERATQRARKLLEEDFASQLEGSFDVLRGGAVASRGGAHLTLRQIVQRDKIVAAIEHKRAVGMGAAEAIADYLRDAAFTTLNRFVALKMLEARGLVQPCISKGEQSSGYREFCGLAPGLALFPQSAGYRLYIESLFDELSTEVKVLFDRRDPASVLWPKRATFEELLEILNVPELAGVWREDETIGWVYQYFNGSGERRAMREVSQTPRNSRELAVRNQFFTPRYVVQFLTDNTLGRIWYEMRGGETVLTERCEYMVRGPKQVFAPRAKKDPRDLRVLDPACGSGHFLLYAFDLLLAIYEEAWAKDNDAKSEATGRSLREDYPEIEALRRSVPGLILAHNLHGVDIDPRCAQIAQLAMWMRVQRAYDDFRITSVSRPLIRRSNIVVAEPLAADDATMNEFLARLRDSELARVFTELVNTLKLAGDLGLLLRVEELVGHGPKRGHTGNLFAPPEERIRATLAAFVTSEGARATMRRRLFLDDATQGMGMLETAEKKFDVVLMNPPFGAGSAQAKKDFEKAYPRSKNDIYAAFVERGIEMLSTRGRLGAITSRTGFFLSSFQKWREEILLPTAPPVIFADLGAGVLDSAMVETAAYCLERCAR